MIINADVMEGLKQIPDASIQCAVTSPPYWGLRDYGTAKWSGGNAECNHMESLIGMSDKNTLGPNQYLPQTNAANVGRKMQYKNICGKCGATRIDNQLGLEKTPEEYVNRLVEIFREVKRVLRNDGTVWLNLGDSYAGSGKGLNGDGLYHGTAGQKQKTNAGSIGLIANNKNYNLKPKDLVGIPWRVAFALQADGWYLRSDIIWAKPNPMPESVTDRPTKAHEYIFLLTKSTKYFYDAEAIAEDSTMRSSGNIERKNNHQQFRSGFATNVPWNGENITRNRRTVWTIATEPFPEAHFATFPTKLVEPCVLAGSKHDDTVLDPFCGSGTVGVVSIGLGRKFIGIELNPKYAEMAERRIYNAFPLLVSL